jgi:hypothetical protein
MNKVLDVAASFCLQGAVRDCFQKKKSTNFLVVSFLGAFIFSRNGGLSWNGASGVENKYNNKPFTEMGSLASSSQLFLLHSLDDSEYYNH